MGDWILIEDGFPRLRNVATGAVVFSDYKGAMHCKFSDLGTPAALTKTERAYAPLKEWFDDKVAELRKREVADG